MTSNTISLSWKKPLFDGGSPVTKYVIEKEQNPLSEDFVSVSSVSNLNAIVADLTCGEKHRFQVKACNEAGESKPSSATDVVLIEDKLGENET